MLASCCCCCCGLTQRWWRVGWGMGRQPPPQQGETEEDGYCRICLLKSYRQQERWGGQQQGRSLPALSPRSHLHTRPHLTSMLWDALWLLLASSSPVCLCACVCTSSSSLSLVERPWRPGDRSGVGCLFPPSLCKTAAQTTLYSFVNIWISD